MDHKQYASRWSRRAALRVGGLSALGIGLGDLFHSESHAQQQRFTAKAKSCILIWLDGGPTHLETFDPKPDAPVEVRGPLDSIATAVPGIKLNECFEQTATIMDQLTVVRSMTSPLGEHNFGTHYLMTGYKPSPALEYPSFGATLTHLRPTGDVLPPNIAVPKFSGNLKANGFLPAATRPFVVEGNPDRQDFKVRDLDFYRGLDLQRLDQRKQFVQSLNAFGNALESDGAAALSPELDRAFQLIASQPAKRAFRLSEESDSVRARYGRGGGSGIGQSCLLARRLVERGVRFVTVHSGGWDSHQDILQLKQRFANDRNAHLPSLDRALSALVEDLSERGLLEETLVLVMGEFGRTPRINARGGRDHWPNVFSVAMAGGGVRGGQAYGQSNALAEYPKDDPVTPSDLAATIFHLLGIDPASHLSTSDGRAVRIAPDGARIIQDLIG